MRTRMNKHSNVYVIWNPKSKLPPRIVFNKKVIAIKVAAKMSEEYNSIFYVMTAVAELKPFHKVKCTLLKND